MDEILTQLLAVSGVTRMLIFGKRMTKRAWLIFAFLALTLAFITGGFAVSFFMNLAECLKAWGVL